MERKWLLAGTAIIVVIAAAAIGALYRGRSSPPVKPPTPVTQTPAPAAAISLQGKIQAKSIVNIAPNTDGIVERFLADVGDDVFEGELIAQIKNVKLASADQNATADADRARGKVADLEGQLIAARLEVSRSRADAT